MAGPEFGVSTVAPNTVSSDEPFAGQQTRIVEGNEVEVWTPFNLNETVDLPPTPTPTVEAVSATQPMDFATTTPEATPVSSASSDEFEFEAVHTVKVTGKGSVPQSVIESLGGGALFQPAALNASPQGFNPGISQPANRGDNTSVSPNRHIIPSGRSKSKKEYENSFHLKEGKTYGRAVGIVALGSVVFFGGLAWVTNISHGDVVAGQQCNSNVTEVISETTHADPAQICEVFHLVGDMTNPMNFLTGDK